MEHVVPAGVMRRASGESRRMSDVMVLHAALPGHLSAVRERHLLARLPYARRLELERRDAAARTTSLLALELLADGIACLRGGSLDIDSLRFPADGKPFLEGGPWFSVSHSRTRLAVALSDRCDVGIDVEDLVPGHADREALERWTAIEATLKALGAGLRQAHQVQFTPNLATAELAGVVVHTRGVELESDCVARIATREPVGTVAVEKGMGDGGWG
jgi:phosphopantetheinyl transferase